MLKVTNLSSGGGKPGYWATSETPTTVTKTSGSSWAVPSDWNDASNTIECYGGGGAGGYCYSVQPTGSAGAAGGGYSKLVNFGLEGYSTLYYAIGSGGTTTSYNGNDGGTTWVNRSSAAVPTSSSQGCRANGGSGGSTNFYGDNPTLGPSSGGTGQYGSVNRTGGGGGDGYSSGGGGGGGCAGTSSNGTTGTDGNTGGGGGSGGGGYAGAGGNGGTSGQIGYVYGGAGGGIESGSNTNGGAGRPGIIVITYYAKYWVPGE